MNAKFFKALCACVILLAANGCTLFINTHQILDNAGTTYVCVKPTKTVYVSGEVAYVEFEKNLYKAHVPLGREIRLWQHYYSPVEDAPVELVYLMTNKENLLLHTVMQEVWKVRRNEAELIGIDPQFLSKAKTTLLIFDEHEMEYWRRYPLAIGEQRAFYWYLLWPLQIPAAIFDVTATLATVVVVGPPMLIVRQFRD